MDTSGMIWTKCRNGQVLYRKGNVVARIITRARNGRFQRHLWLGNERLGYTYGSINHAKRLIHDALLGFGSGPNHGKPDPWRSD